MVRAAAGIAAARMTTAAGAAGALDMTISRHAFMAEMAVEIAMEVVIPVGVVEKSVTTPIAVIELTVSAVIIAVIGNRVRRIRTIGIRPWPRRRSIGRDAAPEHEADR